MRPWKELKLSKWFVTLILLPVISTFITFIQLFTNLHIHLPEWSTRTWLIVLLLSTILILLLLIELLRRSDLRITNELCKEWQSSSQALKALSAEIAVGELMLKRCEHPNYSHDSRLIDDITDWQRGAASALLYQASLNESYRDRFYRGSNTGERTPPLNECRLWMHERLVALKRIRKEIEQLPSHLTSTDRTPEF